MKNLQTLFGPRDLTEGRPLTGITLFAIPLLIGNLVQQLYSTVDAIVVGQYVGDAALGAVGLSFPIFNLMLVLFMGISTGATIVVSQAYGAKDREALSNTVGTTIVLTFLASLIIMVVGSLLARPLLMLMGTPDTMIDMSTDYLVILMLGSAGCAYFNILSGVLRGLGDSVGPLLYLVVASLINIVLDVLFITQFGMTTDGVALATIIAQGISAFLCYVRLANMKMVLDLNRSTLKIDKEVCRRIVQLGVPAGLTQMIFSVANLLVQSLINTLGGTVVTAVTAVMRVDGFAMMPNFTFGIAATTFTGQNVGAKRFDRVHQGAKDTFWLALGVSTTITTCMLLFGDDLMRIFTTTNEIVETGYRMIQITAVGYIAVGVTQTFMGVMRGLGETMVPMWLSIFSAVLIRMPLAYLWAFLTRSELFPHGHPDCIYGSLLVSWTLGAIVTTLIFYRGRWRKKTGLHQP